MRLIFLNTWFGGKIGQPLFDFIKKQSLKTDIFCFMEVTPDFYQKLLNILEDFDPVYDEGYYLKELGKKCGQAIFIKKYIQVNSHGKVSIYPEKDDDAGFLLFAETVINKHTIWVGNVHGTTWPADKLDTPIRINQSKKIIEFFENKDGAKIIGGDFNLMPDTKSIGMFEELGYKNLIKDFSIKTTRNKITWDQFKDQPGFTKQYFADYCFVSSDIKIKNFEVPNLEISDHLPLFLDFDL